MPEVGGWGETSGVMGAQEDIIFEAASWTCNLYVTQGPTLRGISCLGVSALQSPS